MKNITLDDTYSEYSDYYENNDYYDDYENNVHGSNHNFNLYEYIGITLVYLVVCLLGILGNALVIWFGIFRMRKTVNVMWFLSLAVADFSLSFIFLLNNTQILLTYWLYTNFMCKLSCCFLYINNVVCVLQITVISVDRCICVVFPIWSHNHRRPRLAFIIVLIIWIISLAVAVPHTINIASRKTGYDRTICVTMIDHFIFKKMKILELIFLFLLPFIIIVSCYIVIVFYIRGRHNLTSSRPLKTSVAVMIAFFVCWFPFNMFYLLSHKFDFDAVYYISFTGPLLIVLNSCINPILYVFIGRDFKEKFCCSLQARLEKAFIDEDKTVSEKQERSIALQSLHQDCKVEEVIE